MLFKLAMVAIMAYLHNFGIDEKIPSANKEENKDINEEKSLWPPNVYSSLPPSNSPLHVYSQAAVCSDRDICSNIGRVTMEHGGNAMDAAIATLLCNGLVTMQSMGLGGGVLMTFYSRQQRKAFSVLGRERAPLKMHSHLLKTFQQPRDLARSPLGIAVPAEVAAYQAAHEKFGSLPWRAIIKPTVELCHRGYALSRHQRDALFLNEQRIREDELLRSIFIDPLSDEFHAEGAHIYLPRQLCDTYNLLAELGPSSFYNGPVAQNILHDLHELGSLISAKDFKEMHVDIVESLQVDLDPYYVYVPPPPGSGHVLGFVMQILNTFKKSFRKKELQTTDLHRIVEALKFGFVKRWEYDGTIDNKTLEMLLSQEYGKNISHLIDNERTYDQPSHYGANEELFIKADHGTAQISLLSPDGDAVSATSSINYYFGSGRMGSRSGILFNNAISDFTISHLPNYFDLPNIKRRNLPKPHQQPMSSMVPLIVTDKRTGEVQLVTGAAGGSRIISTLAQILVRVLWMQENIKQAIDAPRLHSQLVPNALEYEFGILQQMIDDLEAKGHRMERIKRRNTAVCGVQKSKDAVMANADYRKEGGVDGF